MLPKRIQRGRKNTNVSPRQEKAQDSCGSFSDEGRKALDSQRFMSGSQSLNVSNLVYFGFCEQLRLLMNKC